MNITKHNPFNLRKDIASNQMYLKTKLIRIVKDSNNFISIDRTYKALGRGVYIYPTLDGVDLAQKRNLLSRAMKSKVDESIYEVIRKEISETWIDGQTKIT